MSAVPRASVVVAARNAEETLPRALAALAAQDLSDPYEVIVVDDGSDDATAALAARSAGPVSLLRQPARGPGPARNLGASAARGQVLAFTDADCVPTPSWLRAGLAALARADLVQGAVAPDPSSPLGPYDRSLWIERETGLYETANLFLSKELFDRLGGFETWLEPEIGKALAEDVWLGWRARRAGARTAFCAEALVHHAVFPRGALGYLGERRRLRYFPEIAAKVPEMRRHAFFARFFLTRRSAALDAAVAGSALALAMRSRAPLLLALPYARSLVRRSLPWGRRAPAVALVLALGDLIGLAALVQGSVSRRSPLL